MIDPSHDFEAQIHVRNDLGRRLQREFVAYHRRRRIVRLGGSGLAALLMLGFCSWAWWMRQADRAGAASLAQVVAERPTQSAEVSSEASREVTASSALTSAQDPRSNGTMARMESHFRSIDVQLMTDEELEQSLRELPSDWMVVSIDGELRAFHESELKPAPRRTVRVSRPTRSSWAGG